MKKIWYINNSFKSAPPEFIMLVKTDNAGTSGSNEFTIPTGTTGYNYDVYWEEDGNPLNNGSLSNQTGTITITFASIGNYILKISGDFPRIVFNNGGDRLKVLEVQNWGIINWTSFNSAFQGCSNMVLTAIDVPNLTNVTTFNSAFRDLTLFEDLGNKMKDWNVSNVGSFSLCFQDSPLFNSDISNWNISNCNTFQNMLIRCSAFNQNLSKWNLRTAGVNCQQVLRQAGMSTANYTDTLVGWVNNAVANGNLPINVSFTNHSGNTFDRARSGGANFANAGAARDYMINNLGWTITSDTVIN
jgi:hypothetical protein